MASPGKRGTGMRTQILTAAAALVTWTGGLSAQSMVAEMAGYTLEACVDICTSPFNFSGICTHAYFWPSTGVCRISNSPVAYDNLPGNYYLYSVSMGRYLDKSDFIASTPTTVNPNYRVCAAEGSGERFIVNGSSNGRIFDYGGRNEHIIGNFNPNGSVSGYWYEPQDAASCPTARRGVYKWGRIEGRAVGNGFEFKYGYCDAQPTSAWRIRCP